MSMEVSGGVELREDIARMADLLRASGENGSRACSWILQNAAQPVLEQMLHHPLTDAGMEKFKADYTKVFGNE